MTEKHDESEGPGIILAPYGTLFRPALATYDLMAQAFEREFPGSAVSVAFVSNLMRRRLASREGIRMQGLLGALEGMQDLGVERVCIQSLQIVPGSEFHQLASLVRALGSSGLSGLPELHLGLPLLSGRSDSLRFSSILSAILGSHFRGQKAVESAAEAVVLAGHGTGHPADSQYSLLAAILKKEHRGVFLAGLEGPSGLPELLPELRSSGASAVRLVPFMLVSGGHAEDEIFGADEGSWKSILTREGYSVIEERRGLGECPEVLRIFIEHTRYSLKKM